MELRLIFILRGLNKYVYVAAAHPQLLYKFIYQTMQPGPPVSLKCIATGNPTPQITWRLDGFPLPQNDRSVHTIDFEARNVC